MVDFRYHLVSIVAIFLALAVGIVVGTTALNGAVLDNLRDNVSRLAQDKRDLEGRVTTLQGAVSSGDAFVTEAAPLLIDNRLAGRTVTLIAGPTADGGAVDGVQTSLRAAGATVGIRLRVAPSWVDPSEAAARDDLVARLTPPTPSAPAAAGTSTASPTAAPAVPDAGATSSPDEAAALLLASAVADPAPRAAGAAGGSGRAGADLVSGAAAATVLDGLRRAGFVDVSADGAAGSLVVVVVGVGSEAAADTEEAVAAARTALVALAGALGRVAQGVVVAGSVEAAAKGGMLAAVREVSGRGDAAEGVSTVDGIDTPAGRVTTVLALAAEAEGRTGAFGTGPKADARVPVPTPTG